MGGKDCLAYALSWCQGRTNPNRERGTVGVVRLRANDMQFSLIDRGMTLGIVRGIANPKDGQEPRQGSDDEKSGAPLEPIDEVAEKKGDSGDTDADRGLEKPVDPTMVLQRNPMRDHPAPAKMQRGIGHAHPRS